MNCKICGRNFKLLGKHISAFHNISITQYYDTYINPEANKECPVCGNPLKLLSLNYGYLKHCSHKCSALDTIQRGCMHKNVRNPDNWEVRVCIVCGEGFECYVSSNKIVCSQKCKGKHLSQINKLNPITKICESCGNLFEIPRYWDFRRFCSKQCWGVYVKDNEIYSGENNPNFGREFTMEERQKKSIISKQLWKNPTYRKKILTVLEEYKFESGEKNPSWCGGKSFEEYGREFNDELRNMIRKRDNFTCQECGYTEEQLGYILSCHHIDYDKHNNSEDNLISLCRSCHSKTNWHDRDNWTRYYQDKILKVGGR